MIHDVKTELFKFGLRLNVEKCVAQCNCFRERAGPSIFVENMEIKVVPATEGFSVLGTKYTLCGGINAAFDNRIAAAWSKFHFILPLLRRKDTACHKRLRLFQAVVGRSLLWACESWTLTTKQRMTFRSAQRSMLRRFVAPARKQDEDWIEWVKRATHAAERTAKRSNVTSWVKDYLASKWKWGGARGSNARVWRSALAVQSDILEGRRMAFLPNTQCTRLLIQNSPRSSGALEKMGRRPPEVL